MDEEHEDLAATRLFLMLSHLENTDYPCTVSPFVDKEPMGIAMESIFACLGDEVASRHMKIIFL